MRIILIMINNQLLSKEPPTMTECGPQESNLHRHLSNLPRCDVRCRVQSVSSGVLPELLATCWAPHAVHLPLSRLRIGRLSQRIFNTSTAMKLYFQQLKEPSNPSNVLAAFLATPRWICWNNIAMFILMNVLNDLHSTRSSIAYRKIRQA